MEALPGVPEQARFAGTFSRTEAVEKEELDFFASGHPLVEGLLLELEDGPRGRAGVCDIPSAEASGGGLLCVYRLGAEWTAVVVDSQGKQRPELVQQVLDGLSEARPVEPEELGVDERWADAVRELGARADEAALENSALELALFFRWVSPAPEEALAAL